MTSDDDEKRRQSLLEFARSQRHLKRLLASPFFQRQQETMRRMFASPWFQREREWQRLLLEAEFELQLDEAKAQEPTSTPEAITPPSPNRQSRTERIEAEIEAVLKEADRRGEPWPNGLKLAQQVTLRLRDKGFRVSRDKDVYSLAMQDKYKTKRRDPGERRSFPENP
jgi:hypothetical protein